MGEKRGEMNLPVIILGIFGVFVLFLGVSFIYLSVNGEDYSNAYIEKLQSGEIKNPVISLGLIFSSSDEENVDDGKIIELENGKRIIVTDNNEDPTLSEIESQLVNYASIVLEFYNLHNTLFTSNTPKIEVRLGENIYNIEIKEGDIYVNSGEIDNEDILIETSNEEFFRMTNEEGYASESFSSGRTTIEKKANDFVLFSKGYLSLYKELLNS